MSTVQNGGIAKSNNLHRVTQLAAEDLGLTDVTAPSLIYCTMLLDYLRTSHQILILSQIELLLGGSQKCLSVG